MLMRNCYRVLLLALLLPTATLGLGLGEIHLKSALNAPLDADIDVVGASPDELSGLKAALASRESFGRYRLEYSSFMSGVTLEPRTTPDGHTVLHMRSTDAINEPIATLLVEVNWARGHLVREYTVLLDPPVFSGDAASSRSSVAAPVTGDTSHSGVVERNAPSNAPAVAPSSTSPSPASLASSAGGSAGGSHSSGAMAGGGSYTVRSGDTLSAITAQAYGPGDRVARHRELVGVYRANTSAFDGNMNVLRAGSHLTLPGDAELMAISPGDAAAEVHRQFSTWNEAHGGAAGAAAPGAAAPGGQLHLVPPRESASAPSTAPAAPASAPATTPAPAASAASAANAAAAASAAAAAQQRVTQLESQLAESQRLLQLKNAELAALQARPAQTPSTTAPAPSPAPTPLPATAPPAPTPPPAATAAPPPAAAAPPAAEAPAAAPPAAPVTPAPKAAATAASPSNSFVDLLEEYWYIPAVLIVILVVLLVMRAVRSRQEDAFDRSIGRLSPASFDAKPSPEPETESDTVPVRALAGKREEQSYSVEESGTHEQPVLAGTMADTTASGRHVAIDDNVPAEAPVALDQGDPLAEADFHMAYGLYDQAADLVQIAITREPERRDLRLKLLEVFFVWGNKDRFLATARELAATRDKALPGEWEKIVIMGRQIAPEDALFSSSGALSGAASGGVDLNLEGGQNRIDFDLMGEPTVTAPKSAGGVDLDLGAALGDRDPTGEARARPVSESGVDFVFDDAERGNEQTGSTREMPQKGGAGTTVTVQVAGGGVSDPDAPTIEQPQLPGGDHPTIRQKIDAATRSGMAAEQTAELELHDLGLDLGSMENVGDEVDLASTRDSAGPDAPTVLVGVGDETRQLMSPNAGKAGTGEPTDSGTWLFTDTDFVDVGSTSAGRLGDDAPTELVTQLTPRPAMEPDSSATAQMAALEATDLDLDLGDLNKSGSTQGNGLDLDVGTPASGTEGTFVQTQRIMAEDVPLPDLEPATMSEVGTKLDLARAYMDMGDPEGARSILSEVLSEGSVSQKQEARRLIDTLPG
jgi:pilus assembly protein FimV